jgi:hypothetical protein
MIIQTGKQNRYNMETRHRFGRGGTWHFQFFRLDPNPATAVAVWAKPWREWFDPESGAIFEKSYVANWFQSVTGREFFWSFPQPGRTAKRAEKPVGFAKPPATPASPPKKHEPGQRNCPGHDDNKCRIAI